LDFFQPCNGETKELALDFFVFSRTKSAALNASGVAKFMENDESLVSFLKMHDHDESKIISHVSPSPLIYWQLLLGRQLRRDPFCVCRLMRG
jgi:hypothetical protein